MNRTTTRSIALLSLLLTTAPTLAAEPQADGEDKPSAACYSFTKAAVYRGLGYDHVVTIKNDCKKDLSCEVRTNANPGPSKAKVAKKSSAEVVTYRGSPASEFTAEVSCK